MNGIVDIVLPVKIVIDTESKFFAVFVIIL